MKNLAVHDGYAFAGTLPGEGGRCAAGAVAGSFRWFRSVVVTRAYHGTEPATAGVED